MAKVLRRVSFDDLKSDLAGVLDKVRLEGDVVVVEKDGEPVATVLGMDEYDRLCRTAESRISDDAVERALAAAGVWSDLDTDAMIGAIYEGRHRPATRPPVSFGD